MRLFLWFSNTVRNLQKKICVKIFLIGNHLFFRKSHISGSQLGFLSRNSRPKIPSGLVWQFDHLEHQQSSRRRSGSLPIFFAFIFAEILEIWCLLLGLSQCHGPFKGCLSLEPPLLRHELWLYGERQAWFYGTISGNLWTHYLLPILFFIAFESAPGLCL